MAAKSKNQLRRERAKAKQHCKPSAKQPERITKEVVDIEIVTDAVPENDPMFAEFANVFQRFTAHAHTPEESKPEVPADGKHIEDDYSATSLEYSESDEESEPLSKRQLRKLNKVTLADLKSSTPLPQVVEWYDVDARDPFFHVALKAQLNCVPIPAHWTNKRDYLTGKRGFERQPFRLPRYIADTGIQEMRNTDQEDDSTLRKQQRDRVMPKMGKLDIDYQKLHDAFFKFQTRPRLFAFGDLYYEGREPSDEYSSDVLNVRPGVLSSQLRTALGMSKNEPPAWLQVMSKIGKPPAYRDMYIPGLDVPYSNTGYTNERESHKDKTVKLWGAMHLDDETDESGSDVEADEEEAMEPQEDESGDEQSDGAAEADKISIKEYGGVADIPQSDSHVSSTKDKPLYQILEENSAAGGALSNKRYEMPTKGESPLEDKKRATDDADSPVPKKFKF